MKVNSKTFFRNGIEYIIAFIILINCRTMWTNGISSNSVNEKLFYLLIAVGILDIILSFGKQNNTEFNKLIYLSILIGIYLGIYLCFSSYQPTKKWGLQLLAVVIVFLWIVNLNSTADQISTILIKYKNIVVAVAVISLFFWLFGSTFHIIKPSGTFASMWASFNGYPVPVLSYYNLYYEPSVTVQLGSFLQLQRNAAIFTEAPMASLNFSIAYLICEYLDDNVKWQKIILGIGICTTFSTTGMILLLIIFLYNFITSKNTLSIKMAFLPIIFLVVIAFIYILISSRMSNDIRAMSTNMRLDDYTAGFQVWKSSPIFGVGLQNNDQIKQFMGNWRSFNTGFSNSIMELLANGGLYLFGGYIFCFVKGMKNSLNLHNRKKMLFIISVFYLFVTTIFTYTYILFFILIWFCLKNNSYNKE